MVPEVMQSSEDSQIQLDEEKTKPVSILKSRKFWIAIGGVLVIVLRNYIPEFPLTDDQLTGFIVLLVGWIMGIAVEDAGAKSASK